MNIAIQNELVFSTAADISRTSISLGDASERTGLLPDSSINLCVTSPPYNIGKSYEKGSWASFDEYVAWFSSYLSILKEKLTDNGSLCLQLGNHVKNGIVFPLDYAFFPVLNDLGFVFRNRIVWRYNFGLHAKNRFSGRYEVLLWFTKGPEYKFNLDPVRVPQLYPGKRHASGKGAKAGMPSGNPMGKNPSDFWEFDANSAFFGEPVWDIPNVKAHHPEKTEHPCQFPHELVERCVLALTDAGDTVLDPFVGTGTSVICADMHSRIGIGFDLSPTYVEQASSRLALARAGKLRIRPSGKPPRTPSAGEKVAKVPEEWAGE